MKLNENKLKNQLVAGRTLYGLWVALQGAASTELSACIGYDWLLIDTEHTPNDVANVQRQLQAMAAYDSHPVVRPVNDDPANLKRLLDIGVQSFLIPNVESGEQAANIVKATQYPPQGIRGVSTALTRAAKWGMVDNYLNEAGNEICILAQVESVKGMQNLDDITNTAGIDGVFIGPADLAASMGHLGNAAHPEVQAAIVKCMIRIKELGKFSGILSGDQELVSRYTDLGARFIGIGCDTAVLAKGAKSLLESFKK